jgi:hypothetical protein
MMMVRRWNTIEKIQERYERLIAKKLDRQTSERHFDAWLKWLGREMRREKALKAREG